jgi:hypothetical protein
MGYMKLNYVGKANMKQPSEQWIIDNRNNKKTHCAVQKLPRLVTEELNFMLFQSNKFS